MKNSICTKIIAAMAIIMRNILNAPFIIQQYTNKPYTNPQNNV